MKKYYILLTGAILAATIQTQAQTKIGGTGAPDPSAMLEVTGGTGNNKGILLPRVPLANITAWGLSGSTPVAGMFVYNTNASITGGSGVGTYYWDGTQWVKSTSASASGWNLTGNAGTTPATNFLGTTDNQSLVMRTNAVERVRIDSIGRVGINDATPRAALSFGSAQGSKIRLYDNNTDTLVYGFSISNASLNYIVENTDAASHRFWSGGNNDNGTELMRIQGNGNVGIATSSPAQTLHVQGTARVTGSSGTPTTIAGRNAAGDIGNVAIGTGLSLTSGTLSATVSASGWALGGNTGTNPAINYIGTTDAQPLLLRTNALERMRISAAGNVGIFNNNPLSPLSFASSVGSKISLYDAGSATDNFGFGIASNTLAYHVVPGGVHAFFAGGKAADGTELMRIQGDGNVGIGTTAPAAKLDVNGTARIQGSAGTPIAILGRDATGNINNIALGANLSLAGGILSASGGGTTGWGLTGNAGTSSANFLGTTDAQPLVFATAAAERLRITTTGNVGIGNSAPASPLSFGPILGNKIAFYDGGAGQYHGIGVSAAQLNYHVGSNSDHVFFAGGINGDGSELMRIHNNGFVGIGTSTPDSRLTVVSDGLGSGSSDDIKLASYGASVLPTFYFQASTGTEASPGNTANNTQMGSIRFNAIVGGTSTTQSGIASNYTGNGNTQGANLTFMTSQAGSTFAERMIIGPTGNVGIGTSTPNNHVQIAKNDYGQFGGVSISDVAGANASNFTITPGYYGSIATFGVTLDVTGEAPISFSDPIIPAADGQFSCGTSAYRWSTVYALNGTINTSDARMKKNIRNLDLGLDAIMKLRPVVYDWKDDTGKDKLGFIAQELRKAVPNVVVGDESKETLGVLYSDMIPVLTKAIQEQQAKIESQDQKINALVAENQKLKTTEVELKENKAVTAQLMERVKQMEQMMGINEIEGTSKVAGK